MEIYLCSESVVFIQRKGDWFCVVKILQLSICKMPSAYDLYVIAHTYTFLSLCTKNVALKWLVWPQPWLFWPQSDRGVVLSDKHSISHCHFDGCHGRTQTHAQFKIIEKFYVKIWTLKIINVHNFISNSLWFPKHHCFLEGPQPLPFCTSGKSNM